MQFLNQENNRSEKKRIRIRRKIKSRTKKRMIKKTKETIK